MYLTFRQSLLCKIFNQWNSKVPYLGTTGSVLGGTTGDQLSVPGEEVLIDAHVLLLSEDSIVGLQAILLKESGITREN